MAVTVADIQAIPQFATRGGAEIQFWLTRAPQHLDLAFFAADADLAVTYWTAHALTVAAASVAGAAGPITGKTVGPVSVQYAAAHASGRLGDWSLSVWGGYLAQLSRAAVNGADLVA